MSCLGLQPYQKCTPSELLGYVSRPSSCATRSHMVTPAPLLELPVSHISNYTRNPQTEVDTMSLSEVTVYGRSHTERLYSLVFYETFTLVPFRFLCACLANLHVPCATYLIVFPV